MTENKSITNQFGAILGFHEDYRWLSNFWHAPVVLGDHLFEWNEKWFMVHKTLDPTEASEIMRSSTPGDCKRLGKLVTLRPDWEDIKDSVMLEGLRLKFGQHQNLAEKLRKTQARYLEETNHWNDTYWGVCNGVGRNMLGILLMQVRAELTIV